MKRILGTITLTCVLSVSALAGEIPTCNCKAVRRMEPPAGSTKTGVQEDASAESGNTKTGLLQTFMLTLVSLAVR